MQGTDPLRPAQTITIRPYAPEHHPYIRKILTKIGWAEQYISSAEQNVERLSQDQENYGVFVAFVQEEMVGFLYIQYYAWNRLCQIHGLAVSPEFQRQGVATALVARAEAFAHARGARGVYVDTPVTNTGGRRFYEAIGYQPGYVMPRYYEDHLDGITYQRFFQK
jgi:ribosomal protein S18 acetylase RimI-like enzyme